MYRHGNSGCLLRKPFAHLAVYDTLKGADSDIYVECVGNVEGFAGEVLRVVKEIGKQESIPNHASEGIGRSNRHRK